jgi:hypothetical protein
MGYRSSCVKALETYNITNYFLFDMSVPDALVYIRQGGFNVYTRQSEYEKEPSFYSEAKRCMDGYVFQRLDRRR